MQRWLLVSLVGALDDDDWLNLSTAIEEEEEEEVHHNNTKTITLDVKCFHTDTLFSNNKNNVRVQMRRDMPRMTVLDFDGDRATKPTHLWRVPTSLHATATQAVTAEMLKIAMNTVKMAPYEIICEYKKNKATSHTVQYVQTYDDNVFVRHSKRMRIIRVDDNTGDVITTGKVNMSLVLDNVNKLASLDISVTR